MDRIGLRDTPENRAYAAGHMRNSTGNGFERTFENEYGTYGVTNSALHGPCGAVNVESGTACKIQDADVAPRSQCGTMSHAARHSSGKR
ncbi:hypothetical protein AB0M46_34230 [Dactylosporangium sp. NPDC051485]|uniref:hypothetical protein n=1 Tax=Dactylosporangium sp. NPDC051485 TaxID=3154846 RepID=UPI00343143B1